MHKMCVMFFDVFFLLPDVLTNKLFCRVNKMCKPQNLVSIFLINTVIIDLKE